jgi:quinol monooxygenase YgiN
MSKVAVVATLKAKAGKRDELVSALGTAIETANGEAGTLLYILHGNPADENSLLMYELYTGHDALGAHVSSDAFKALGASIGHLVDGQPELTVLTPLSGKGL